MRQSIFCALVILVTGLLIPENLQAESQSVATISGTDKVITVKLPVPYNETVYAGTFKGTVDGKATSLYCIDISHPLAFNDAYNDVEATDYTLSYILNNYYPYKQSYSGALSPIENEAGAVQLALWHFTDNLDVNKVAGASQTVISRALAIITDATTNAHSFNLNYFSIVLPPQTYSTGAPVYFSVQAFNETGLAMPNVQINLSTSAGTLSSTTVTTGVNGVSPVVTLNPNGNISSAVITATGVVGIPSGTKYYNTAQPNAKQKLILAKATTASRTITQKVNWTSPISLSVTKTADKTTINNGDIVNYTIVVKNSGGSAADNVQVSDQLQTALQYVSNSQSDSFNPSTGIWSVGYLNSGESKTIVIKTKANLASGAPSFDLGVAKDYNMFITDTLTQPSSDTEGKLAVGLYAELQNYSVGDKLPLNSGNVLVTGGHLHFLTGRVYNGSAVYGNFITSTTAFSADDSIYKSSDIVDFQAAGIYLKDLSDQLSLLSQNGSQNLEYGELALTGTDSSLNIFNVDGSKFSGINNFTINAPSGSTVLVNISGNISSWSGGFNLTGVTRENVLLNFTNCTDVKISNIEIRASILAPRTRINFPSGLITGQVIAKCLSGSVQINNYQFGGTIANSVAVANVATIVNASQKDMSVPMNNIPAATVVNGFTPLTSVNSAGNAVPKQFKLEQNYPNPFNPSTVISFSVAKQEFVSLNVYDISGRIVKRLINDILEPGSYSIHLDASDFSSGIYLYRFSSRSYSSTRKMLLIK